jgi:nitrogen-specific signal transduction histidine kinase
MEQALQKSEENLRQAQKLESIGQMAGGIAHDFNNLLATILIQSEVLLKSIDKKLNAEQLAERVQKGVEQIKKSSERATSLTRQLLAFSRKQIILPVVLNLNDLISEMQEMLLRVVEKNISFHLKLDPSVKNINIDPGHLEQIVINLVMNSRDALPNGGNIHISSNNCSIDAITAKINNIEPGTYVCLSIADDGTGMTDAVKKNVFEPFFTTKPVGKGTGLGLSTVYGIVRQNKGMITLESSPGKGSEFTIYLPSTSEAVAEIKPQAVGTDHRGNEKILVVEDEDDLRVLLQETLTDFGYTVETAANGSEALSKLTPDLNLIITDVVMPQMGGAELAAKALKLNPKLKVIFQSGYTKNTLDQAGLPSEQIFFLAKPYKIDALINEIKKILS